LSQRLFRPQATLLAGTGQPVACESGDNLALWTPGARLADFTVRSANGEC
jgi:hypothetical protein